jgi:hypothetical protein
MTNSRVPVHRANPKTANELLRSVLETQAFLVPEPGPFLAEFLIAGELAGRPGWYVTAGPRVPALRWTDEFHNAERGNVIPRIALVAIRTCDPVAMDMAIENERTHAALRKLTVAMQFDLLGLDADTIGTLLREGEPEAKIYREPRTLQKLRDYGRAAWQQLGAWPWWNWPGGWLPKEWWLEEQLAAQLLLWRSPELASEVRHLASQISSTGNSTA